MCALQGLGERIQALNKEVFGGVLSSEQLQQLESSEAKQVLCLVIYHIICCMLCGVPCITGALTHYIKGVVTY